MTQNINFDEILKSIGSNMVSNFQTADSNIADLTVTGSTGDNAVSVTLNGKFECTSCEIKWDEIDNNKTVATNLVAVAITEAIHLLLKKTATNPIAVSAILQKITSDKSTK